MILYVELDDFETRELSADSYEVRLDAEDLTQGARRGRTHAGPGVGGAVEVVEPLAQEPQAAR